MESFSIRQGLEALDPATITVRNAAPNKLRTAVATVAYIDGLEPKQLRSIICKCLRVAPDYSNTSNSQVKWEVKRKLNRCDWHRVYDIIEAISYKIWRRDASYPIMFGELFPKKASYFDKTINSVMREEGIGWKLIEGKVIYRGEGPFEAVAEAAPGYLKQASLPIAANELQQALNDMSRRPDPDLSGAIQHAYAGVECVVRQVCGDNATLGDLLKRYPDKIPPALSTAIGSLWGYASQYGRHMEEGKDPDTDDVSLAVQVAMAIAAYLSRKVDGGMPD